MVDVDMCAMISLSKGLFVPELDVVFGALSVLLDV